LLELNRIYNMDCLEGMKLLDDNSVDSIVTDPPYELGFMGKKWDSTGIAYNVDVWRECLRVLKPGGHLLAFGGTRTYHRMTCAIEDAGFEIRDCIQWLYGSGFPKSYNIAKGIEGKILHGNANTTNYKNLAKKNERKQGMGFNDIHLEQGDRPTSYELGGVFDLDATTPEAKQWDGWGTALKPANEPIVVARKPLSEKTVAENVLKWGTGGINIDDCRIPTNDKLGGGALTGSFSASEGWDRPWRHDEDVIKEKVQETKLKVAKAESLGRFPANVILDEEAGQMLDEQSGSISYGNKPGGYSYSDRQYAVQGFVKNCKPKAPSNYGDSGGASRFFYCAKASKKERGEGNNHPTVKPVSLIKYLVTLVTPPDGVCLDPFMGSGTTAVACIKTNRKYIGFEIDPDYYEVAQERIRIHIGALGPMIMGTGRREVRGV
jgi:DNA modification methylase